MVTDSVAVVTGGASRIGLETARLLARDHHIVLADASSERLTRALDRLDALGVSAESIAVDLTDGHDAELLMRTAHSAGRVAAVVHLPPATAPAESSCVARAASLVHVTKATLTVAQAGTVLVHAGAGLRPAIPRWIGRFAPPEPATVDAALSWLTVRAPTAAQGLVAAFVGWQLADLAPRLAATGARMLTDVPAGEGAQGAALLADLCDSAYAA